MAKAVPKSGGLKPALRGETHPVLWRCPPPEPVEGRGTPNLPVEDHAHAFILRQAQDEARLGMSACRVGEDISYPTSDRVSSYALKNNR